MTGVLVATGDSICQQKGSQEYANLKLGLYECRSGGYVAKLYLKILCCWRMMHVVTNGISYG